MLPIARHFRSLRSEGSIACHTYLDRGYPLYGHLRELVTLTRIAEPVTTCPNDLGLSRLGFEHQPSACVANTLTDCASCKMAQRVLKKQRNETTRQSASCLRVSFYAYMIGCLVFCMKKLYSLRSISD